MGTVIRFHLLWYLYSEAFFFFPVLHFVSSLSSSFFQGGIIISRSFYSPFFLPFLLLSLLRAMLVPLGILIVRVFFGDFFSFYAF